MVVANRWLLKLRIESQHFTQSAFHHLLIRTLPADHRARSGACRGFTVCSPVLLLEIRPAEPRAFDPPYILSLSRRRFFLSFSLGLVAAPSSQESTFAIVTVSSFSGAITLIVKRVAGPSGISVRRLRRNAAMASTAAS